MGMSLTNEKKLEIFRRMSIARSFEEKVSWFFARGMVHGTTHLSIGQEASGIASAMALREDDLVSLTHRGHSQIIGKGIDVNKMMAELLGKATGYCKGKGGSMHIADLETGNLGANGIVGGGLTLVVGAALTQKVKDTGKVVLCTFGDGAANEGTFHEGINMASIWNLPIIFFCENNLYGMSMSAKRHMNIDRISDRAHAYGIQGISVDGNCVQEVYEAVEKAAEKCRRGEGPVLIESRTYRWLGHSKSDANVYRTKEEIEDWKSKCPITGFRQHLIDENIATEADLETIVAEAKAVIEEAVEFAQNSPDPSVESLTEDVYA